MGCGEEFEIPEETGSSLVADEEGGKVINSAYFEGQKAGKWWIEGDNAKLQIGEEDSTFQIMNANGFLYNGEEVASRFTAKEGEGDTGSEIENSGRLILIGNVIVTSEQESVTLTADEVTYNEATQLIEADGNVMVTSDTFESGPYDKLVTTPSLDRFGTPDNFKDETP